MGRVSGALGGVVGVVALGAALASWSACTSSGSTATGPAVDAGDAAPPPPDEPASPRRWLVYEVAGESANPVIVALNVARASSVPFPLEQTGLGLAAVDGRLGQSAMLVKATNAFDSTTELDLLDLSGPRPAAPKKLLAAANPPYPLAPAPDGHAVVAWDTASGQIIALDGASAPIVLGTNIQTSHAAWSPDSAWVAFDNGQSEATDQPGPELSIMAAKTGASPEALGTPQRWKWSPKGPVLAYYSMATNSPGLWILDRRSDPQAPAVQVSTAPVASATWAPDGSFLVYQEGSTAFATVSVGAAPVTGAVPTQETVYYDAVWFSPDGKWLLYADANTEAWMAHANGASFEAPVKVGSSPLSPTFTSDSKYLVFGQYDGKSAYTWQRIDLSKNPPDPPVTLATGASNDPPPLLTSDDAWLVYPAQAGLSAVRIDGSQQPVVLATGDHVAWQLSPDGWLAYEISSSDSVTGHYARELDVVDLSGSTPSAPRLLVKDTLADAKFGF